MRGRTLFDDGWCLAGRSLLINILPSRFRAPFPSSFSQTVTAAWRDLEWPVAYFLPERVLDPVLRQTGPEPGSLCFGSDTMSIWKNPEFLEFFFDIGELPIVVVGGDLDRSVIAVAIGAAEREAVASFVPCTAGCSPRIGRNARRMLCTLLRNFAIEVSAQELMVEIKARQEDVSKRAGRK
jgi:hypothetical protein